MTLNTRPFRPLALQTLVALASIIWVSAMASPQAATLRLKLPVGKKLVYTTVMEMSVKMNMPKTSGGSGKPMDMSMTTRATTEVKVNSKTAKGFKVTSTVTEAKSTAPAGSMMAGMAAQMDAQMKGKAVEAVYDQLGNSVGSMTMGGASMGPMGNSVSGINAGFMGIILPKGPASVGTKWSSVLDLGKAMGAAAAGSNKIPIQFKLLKFETRGTKRLAYVSVSMKGALSVNAGTPQQGAKPMKMTGNVDLGGTMVIDTATGIPQSSDMSGVITMNAMGTPVTQRMTVKLTLK